MRKNYKLEVDMWSLGVTLYYLFFQTYPYLGDNDQILESIMNKRYDLRNQDYNTVSKKAIDLIDHLLVCVIYRFN